MIPDLGFGVSFFYILYNFKKVFFHTETRAKVAPLLVFPWQDPNTGLRSFLFYFSYPPQSGIFSNISTQKFGGLRLTRLVTFILVQCLVKSKILTGLLSEGVNKDSYFCFLLEAVSLVFGFFYLNFPLHSGHFSSPLNLCCRCLT